MRVVVVYESTYGNTEAIARAIGEGLSDGAHVEVVSAEVAAAHPPTDVELIVAGGPTHAFGLSRPQTRAEAVEDGRQPATSVGCGIREWIATLPATATAATFATFDTRIRRPRVPGSAARAAARRLKRLGYVPLDRPHSFFVAHGTGPLVEGELERARRWGSSLCAAVQHRPAVGSGPAAIDPAAPDGHRAEDRR
jgi:hypothetical protein